MSHNKSCCPGDSEISPLIGKLFSHFSIIPFRLEYSFPLNLISFPIAVTILS